MGESRKGLIQVVPRLVVVGALTLAALLTHMAALPASASLSISSVDATGRVALGDSHTCAITNDNAIWCWGDNNSYQLGVGSSGSVPFDSAIPLQVIALGGGRVPQKLAAGSLHTCALATDGTVWCWGGNGNGSLGDGTLISSGTPSRVILAGASTLIAAGGSSTCAVLTDNRVQCWGKNQYGQLGLNTSGTTETTPQVVTHIPEWFTVAQIELGVNHTCAVSTVGGLWCWGNFSDGRLGTTQSSNVVVPAQTSSLGGTAQMVSAGGSHTCVVLNSGSVSCFGKNNNAQLGQPVTTSSSATPTVVTLSGNAQSVATGTDFTCASLTAGGVSCFGANSFGQIGSGSTSTRESNAGSVVGVTGSVEEVVAGANHACAVKSNGQLLCWGNNDFGKTGSNTGNVMETSAVAVGSLNVVPTTTTTTTTTTSTPVVVTLAPSSTVEAATAPPSTESAASSTTALSNMSSTIAEPISSSVTPQLVLMNKVVVHALQVKRGAKVSASKIAAAVSMVIPKTSKGSMRIVIVSGGTHCIFTGSSIEAIRIGKCTIAVTLMPKKGKSVTRRTSISVR